MEHAINIEKITANVTLSCGGEFALLWGFNVDVVLGYIINGQFSLEQNESSLKDNMKKELLEKLKVLPLVEEKIDEIMNKLHYDGDLQQELINAYNFSNHGKYKIYLCIH